jgi:hypothetical protein
MPLDQSDAEGSFLYGRAEFNKWVTQFVAMWYSDDILLYMAAAVKDAGVRGMLDNPEAVTKLDKLVKKLTGRE